MDKTRVYARQCTDPGKVADVVIFRSGEFCKSASVDPMQAMTLAADLIGFAMIELRRKDDAPTDS